MKTETPFPPKLAQGWRVRPNGSGWVVTFRGARMARATTAQAAYAQARRLGA